jgi:hypothetical protein
MANPVLVAQINPNPISPGSGISINVYAPTYNIAATSIISGTLTTNYRYGSDPQLIGSFNGLYNTPGTYATAVESGLVLGNTYSVPLVSSIQFSSINTTYRNISDPQIIGSLNGSLYNQGTLSTLSTQSIYQSTASPDNSFSAVSGRYVQLPLTFVSTTTGSAPTTYSSSSYLPVTGSLLSVATNYAIGANAMGSGVANGSGPTYVVVAEKTIATQSYDTANGNPIINFYIANTNVNPANNPVLSVPVQFQPSPTVLNITKVANTIIQTTVNNYNNTGLFGANNLPGIWDYSTGKLVTSIPVSTTFTPSNYLVAKSPTSSTSTTASVNIQTNYSNGLVNANNLPGIWDYSSGYLTNYKSLYTQDQTYSFLQTIAAANFLSITTAYYGTGGNFDPKSPFLGGTTAYWS